LEKEELKKKVRKEAVENVIGKQLDHINKYLIVLYKNEFYVDTLA
jgi:single-stranded DNA-specific DHH superfamily exonuclease